MLKKILVMLIFSLGIAIVSQFAGMNKTFAADVFACKDDKTGGEIYVYAINYNANEKTDVGFTQYSVFDPFDIRFNITPEEASKAYIAKIKIVSNGKVLSSKYGYRFVEHDGMIYFVQTEDDKPLSGGETDRLSQSPRAKSIYQASKKFIETEKKESAARSEITQMSSNAAAFIEKAQFQEAINVFNSILKKYPDNSAAYTAYYGIGFCYQSMQKYSEAVKALQKSISIKPTADAYKWLGVSYSGLNDGDNAIKNLSTAVSRNPKDHEAYFYLAMANINFKQDYVKAAEYCEKAISIYPRRDFQYYRILGLCYLSSGNYSKAVNAYSEAISLKPNDGELYASRAYTYEYLQEFAKAEKDYKTALKYDPNFQPAKDGLARVKQN